MKNENYGSVSEIRRGNFLSVWVMRPRVDHTQISQKIFLSINFRNTEVCKQQLTKILPPFEKMSS